MSDNDLQEFEKNLRAQLEEFFDSENIHFIYRQVVSLTLTSKHDGRWYYDCEDLGLTNQPLSPSASALVDLLQQAETMTEPDHLVLFENATPNLGREHVARWVFQTPEQITYHSDEFHHTFHLSPALLAPLPQVPHTLGFYLVPKTSP